MNVMKKISLALSTAAILAGSSFGAQLLTGGNIPLVNNITGIGVVTLDFGSPGTDAVLATFILNNNSATFDVSWVLTNGGNFLSSGSVIPIVMSNILLNETGSGVLGTAVTPASDLPVVAMAVTPASTIWNYNQSTATVNYTMNLSADWADPSSMLAGLYTEQVVFSVTATL